MSKKLEIEKVDNGFIFKIDGKIFVSTLKNQSVKITFNKCLQFFKENTEKPVNSKIKIKNTPENLTDLENLVK